MTTCSFLYEAAAEARNFSQTLWGFLASAAACLPMVTSDRSL